MFWKTKEIYEQSLVVTLYNRSSQRLECRDRLVYSDCCLPALAFGWRPTLPRLPPHLVARHVACVWTCRFDARVFDRPLLDSACWHFKRHTLGRRLAPTVRAYANRRFLGTRTGDDGDTRGNLDGEVPATDEHTLVEGRLLLRLCCPRHLDVQQVIHCGQTGTRLKDERLRH